MILQLTLALAIVYLSLCFLFYLLQHYFFFRPEILPSTFKYEYPFPFEEIQFNMEDGGVINSIYFQVPNALGVVYYLKGNSKSIKGWGKFAKDYLSLGYDFFMMDYRGFGKSRGKRTENILYSDAQYMYKWLVGKYAEDKIVVIGRSYGTGIATRIASWNRPKMLVLDSPYFSFLHLIKHYGFFLPVHWLLRYRLRTDQFIKQVTCPVYLLHGDKDRLIPYSMSKQLVALKPENIKLITVKGGGHNNLPDYPSFHEALYSLLVKGEAHQAMDAGR